MPTDNAADFLGFSTPETASPLQFERAQLSRSLRVEAQR